MTVGSLLTLTIMAAAEPPEGVQIHVRPLEARVALGAWSAVELEIVAPDSWSIFAFGQPPDVSAPTYFRLQGAAVRTFGAPIEPKPRERSEKLFDARKIRYFEKRLRAQQRYVVATTATLGRQKIKGELSVMLADDRLGRLHLVTKYPFEFEVELTPAAPKKSNAEPELKFAAAEETTAPPPQPHVEIDAGPAAKGMAASAPIQRRSPASSWGFGFGAAAAFVALLVGPRGPLATGGLWSRLAAWKRSASMASAGAALAIGLLAGFGPLATASAVCVIVVVLGLLAALPALGGKRRGVQPVAAALGTASLVAAACLALATAGAAAWDFGFGFAGLFLFRAILGARGAETAPSFAYSWEKEFAETVSRRRSKGRAA